MLDIDISSALRGDLAIMVGSIPTLYILIS